MIAVLQATITKLSHAMMRTLAAWTDHVRQGKYEGHDAAIKIFNTGLHAALDAFATDLAAHKALDRVQPPLTVKLLGTGLMEHLHPPAPFIALAMAGPAVSVMVTDPQCIETAWCARAEALVKRVHAQHYLHGDLRPEHFRQTADGHLLLIDLDRCKPSSDAAEHDEEWHAFLRQHMS